MLQESSYQPGYRIADRYEIASWPLKGGMGIVYLCYDHFKSRPVALKTFRSKFLPNREARDRFLSEGTKWVRLGRHPHIVRAYEVERIGDGREIYLVLELVAKEDNRPDASLRAWLTPGKPLLVKQALIFGIQIVRGMTHAVATIPGFIHRDLKPENVLIGRDKLSTALINRVRLTDFGLAWVPQGIEQLLSSNQSAVSPYRIPGDVRRPQLTQGIVGTPLYMAPEQWRKAQVTLKADIYAVGCILYEMVTGYPAVSGQSLAALEKAHCEGKIRPLPTEMPKVLAKVISRCLALAPETRYDRWDELENELGLAYKEITGQLVPEPEPMKALDRAERVANGSALNVIGVSYMDIGKAKTALRYFEQARNVGQTEKELSLEAAGLQHLGMAYFRLGKVQKALTHYESAIAINKKIGDRYSVGIVLLNMGNVYHQLGNFEQARRYYEQVLTIFREIGDREGIEKALASLGMTFHSLGDTRRASITIQRHSR